MNTLHFVFATTDGYEKKVDIRDVKEELTLRQIEDLADAYIAEDIYADEKLNRVLKAELEIVTIVKFI